MRIASLIAMLTAIAVVAGRDTDAASAAMATDGADAAAPAGPGACEILPESVWRELLGEPYYGPEESGSSSGGITLSRCKYNGSELTLWRPAPFRTADEIANDMRSTLESNAEEDRKNGMEWKVDVRTTTEFGVPAVVGSVIEDVLSMHYLKAIAPDGTMVGVQSADDAETAAALMRRVLAALSG